MQQHIPNIGANVATGPKIYSNLEKLNQHSITELSADEHSFDK